MWNETRDPLEANNTHSEPLQVTLEEPYQYLEFSALEL
jgi:hypothetical protein